MRAPALACDTFSIGELDLATSRVAQCLTCLGKSSRFELEEAAERDLRDSVDVVEVHDTVGWHAIVGAVSSEQSASAPQSAICVTETSS